MMSPITSWTVWIVNVSCSFSLRFSTYLTCLIHLFLNVFHIFPFFDCKWHLNSPNEGKRFGLKTIGEQHSTSTSDASSEAFQHHQKRYVFSPSVIKELKSSIVVLVLYWVDGTAISSLKVISTKTNWILSNTTPITIPIYFPTHGLI